MDIYIYIRERERERQRKTIGQASHYLYTYLPHDPLINHQIVGKKNN